jgi:hypothetical protein
LAFIIYTKFDFFAMKKYRFEIHIAKFAFRIEM